MTSAAHSQEEDPDGLDPLSQWTLFLRDYAKGNQRAPPPPLNGSRKNSESPPSLPAFDVPLYPPGEISPETARIIAEFYDQYGFLPPPRADEEAVRLRTIQEYNLFREDQAENFHRCSSLVTSFFPFAPICTISLFHNAVQVVVSKGGEFPVALGEELVTETSICGHVVLKKNGEPTELLGETTDDWRFTGNPWCAIDTGVKGYVGVPITLEVDPSSPRDSERVTVGVIALMGNRPFPKLTDNQRKVLDDLSSMLSAQLRSTWEGWRRGKEMRLRNAVSLFLQTALVEPSQQAIMDNSAARSEPPVQGSDSGRSTPSLRGGDATALTEDLFANAAEQLKELLEADFAIIVDLTSFHATKVNGRRKRSHTWVEGRDARTKGRRILASSSSPVHDQLSTKFDTPEAMAAVAKFLDLYFVTGRSVFSGLGDDSGFEGLLSSLSPNSTSTPPAERGTKAFQASGGVAHLALPFYSANRPNLLVVIASAAPFFTFQPADVTFVNNLGAMLVAHLAQRTIVEADAAKTAFVSQISHELRTPLHGLLGQLDLVRDSFASKELSMVPALLDSAEYCGAALRDIVDDVLDFGKMQSSPTVRPRPVLVDLAQIILENTRSCWLRRLQWQTISAPSGSQFGPMQPSSVQLVVEYEDRSKLKDWWVSLDAPGFIRILNNLVTNSLKYTAEGLITVSLVSGLVKDAEENDTPQITLRVEDTGCGIDPDFMDKIFDPFTQADAFSPGAGLGLHITRSLVERMKGTIAIESRPGAGTIFTVVFPVEDIGVAPSGKPRAMMRTFISSEPSSRSPEMPISPSASDDTPNEKEKRLGYPPTPQDLTANSKGACGASTPPTSIQSSTADFKRASEIETHARPTHLHIDNANSRSASGESKIEAPLTPTASSREIETPASPTIIPPPTPAQTSCNNIGAGEDEPHLTILVVDDNAISRKILVAMLKRLNVTTHQADDGLNALEVFRKVHPHVVWTDIGMPRMDGITAAGEMRQIERERGWSPSHIVAITGLGLTDEHIRREGLLGPAALDGWLIKGQTNAKTFKESLIAVRRKLRLEEERRPP
ncbi:hypothetical protein B0H19DRAFT_1101310 [Mycena capillaripes]|nr:hypothetical protein B0H19DRAFT_1101310 [Mycena capillaripes]